MAAQIQQLPHTAQRSIHRRYLGRRGFLDPQCFREPGTTHLDLPRRALCAASDCAPRYLQPYQVTASLAATPTDSFADVFRRYARWEIPAAMVPWSRAAFLFFLLAGVSIGRFLRVEYSGSLPWKDHLPDRRGNSLKARVRRWQVVWANVLIVAPLLLFGLCLTHVILMDPATFTFRLFFCWPRWCGLKPLAEGRSPRQYAWNKSAGRPALRRANGRPPGGGELVGQRCWLCWPCLRPSGPGGHGHCRRAEPLWMKETARWLLLYDSTSVQLVLGTLLFFWLPPLTMVLASGMIGKNFPGWLGEWLARIRATP